MTSLLPAGLGAVNAEVPVVLTIAGSDSSSGAGLQADLKTFAALGVYGLTAVTCVVAEIPGKVSRIEPIRPEMVRRQIDVLAEGFPIAAVKTGLLYSAEIIEKVAHAIADLRQQKKYSALIVDPVITATSGERLLEEGAIRAYEKHLFPLSTLITPNLDEAAQLLGSNIQDRPSMEKAVRALAEKYGVSTLLKGGHLEGDKAVDLLCVNGKVTEFAAPFIRGVATHGTGCAYSAAITVGIACGFTLEEAIGRAKNFITSCIGRRFQWSSNGNVVVEALNHLSSR